MINEQEKLDQNIKENWLSRMGVQKPYTVFVCIMAIIILGVFAFSSMKVDLFPSMNMPYAIVAVSPNSDALQQKITKKMGEMKDLDDAAKTLKLVDWAVEFAEHEATDAEYDATDDKNAVLVILGNSSLTDEQKNGAIYAIKDSNPVAGHFMSLISAQSDQEIFGKKMMSLFMPTTDQLELLTDDIATALSTVNGVANTSITTVLRYGVVLVTLEYQSNATVDRTDLDLAMRKVTLSNDTRYGLSYTDPNILQIDPSLLPIMQITVACDGKNDAWFEKNVLTKLKSTTGVGQVSSNIKTSDLSSNQDDQAWQSSDSGLINTYSISIQKSSNAVTTDVAANVLTTLQKIATDNPGFKYDITSSQAEYINQSIGSVGENLIVGGILALIILFLFLRSIKMTLAIGISIPLALVGTFVVMYFMGIGLNIVSMSGLALAVGMLVDNSVVVLENIYRLRSKNMPIKEACVKGASQIMMAMLASSLTTICVFFPMFFLEGMMMEIFTDLIWVVILSLACSFIVAVMFLPSIVATFKIDAKQPKAVAADQKPSWWQKFVTKIDHAFDNVLRFAINKKWLTVVLALVLFVGSAAMLFLNGFILMPSTDEGSFTVTATLNEVGNSVAEEQRLSQLATPMYDKIKDVLGDDLDACVVSYNSGNGTMSIITGQTGASIQVAVKLKDHRNLSTEAASDKVYKALQNFDNKYSDIEVASSSMTGSLVASDVSVMITSGRADTMQALTDLDAYGAALNAKFTDQVKADLKIKSITLDQTAGKQINKYNGKVITTFTIKAFSDADTNKIQAQLDTFMTELNQNEFANKEISTIDSGLSQQLTDTYTSMGVALLVGFLLIYLVMVAIFQSFLMPLIILICVPLGFTGAFLLLTICRMPLSLPALIGFLILMGVVINNGILAVDYTNQARRDGLGVKEALVASMHTRMRPIFMTALTTILAMVPMALGISIFNPGGSGALMQPLAVVSIGGLLFGTVTTLIVVPAFYAIFCHDKKAK